MVEPAVDVIEDVLCGYPHVGEEEFTGVGCVLADLRQVPPPCEAGHACLDDKQRQTPVRRVRVTGPADDDDEVGVHRTGDEVPRAVQD